MARVRSINLAVLTALTLCGASMASAQDTLSLTQFLARIAQTNPVLRSAALESDVADAEILQARGAFDLFLKSKYERKGITDKVKVDNLDAGLEMPLATALGPRLSTSYRRGNGTGINPENLTGSDGELGLGISVPLWQGLQTDSRRTSLRKAEARPELAQIFADQERLSLLRQASLRYWDWVETNDVLRTMKDIVTLAEDRLRFLQSRARVGEIPAIDTVEAQQELERRRGDYFRAERSAEQASIAARAMLWQSEATGLPQAACRVVFPGEETPGDRQRDADKINALAKRPEIRRLNVQQRVVGLDVSLAQELQRPLIEAQGQMLRSLGAAGDNTFKLGLNISHPLFQRTATAQEEIAQISLQRINFQQRLAERQVQAEIDDALSAIAKAEERIRTAEREVRWSEALQQAEVRKYVAGESTLLVVNIRERALADARIRLTNARADYWRATANYRWATAQL
ncbi:MAG: hypothetical protein RL156_198 [Bacteroidota bacterium]